MSKAAEIGGYWAMSKKAMLIGLGYFAATNPKGTARFLIRVAPPLVHSMARDTYLIMKEAGKELIKPEAVRVGNQVGAGATATGRAIARPMIWGGLAQPGFILLGGGLAQIIQLFEQAYLDDGQIRVD